LDTTDTVIPGLFAAGNATGGLFYNNYPGGTGLTNAAVFGRIAGESAAEFVGKNAVETLLNSGVYPR
jgi:tricarballylate dehydrogenase